jgi:EmrB/QacA subfamily drug resistance transporter
MSTPLDAASAAPVPLYEIPEIRTRRWGILVVLCLSLLLVIAGNGTLNVALPTLARELHATNTELQWVVAGYSLVFAGLLFPAGALGDRFGRKGTLQFGLALFMVGAAAATASNAMWQLIACRALMGVAAACVMPSTLSILVNVFPPHERTRAIAIWASIAGGGAAAGPVASGLLLSRFWYGSVFLINIPIAAIALTAGYFLVPKSKNPSGERLDPGGALLSVVGIGAIVFGLIEAPDRGWLGTTPLLAFAVGLVALVVFVVYESRIDQPMLDIGYFRNRSFSTGTGGLIVLFLAMFGMMFLVIQYFQLVLGFSALSSAVRFLPIVAVLVTVTPQTPRLSERFVVNRVVAAGMTTVAIGLFLLSQVRVDTSYLYVVLTSMLMVSGIGLSQSPMTSAIMSAVPPSRAGVGSATNDATREVGATLGIAVLGSIAASQYQSHLEPALRALPRSFRAIADGSLAGAFRVARQLPGASGDALAGAARQAFVDGMHVALTVGSGLALVGAVVVWRTLPRVTTHGHAARNAPNPPEPTPGQGTEPVTEPAER